MNRALEIPDAKMADRYVLWLSSLSADIKLGIIEGLSASLRHAMKKDKDDMDFVNKLSGAWDDGTSIEEKMNEIRNPERSVLQREVKAW